MLLMVVAEIRIFFYFKVHNSLEVKNCFDTSENIERNFAHVPLFMKQTTLFQYDICEKYCTEEAQGRSKLAAFIKLKSFL